MSAVILSASILAADFAYLADDVKAVLTAGADSIHFDVMDHHYVPNLSVGAIVCAALRHAGIEAPIDVHLMVSDPYSYIQPFAQAGANLLTFHPETVDNVRECIATIRSYGMQVGLALNPDDAIDSIADYLLSIDLLLIMSVYPGFGGQAFIERSYDKIKIAHHRLQAVAPHVKLAVDGGVSVNNVAQIIDCGANFCVVGSGLFAADNYQQRVDALRAQIAQAVLNPKS